MVLRLALLAVVLVGMRFFVHATENIPAAIITPNMDAHRTLSQGVDVRFDRLLHDHPPTDRTRRPRLIALTFDDGPYAVLTPLLLARLHDLHVPATFFFIGRDVQQQPELTQRVIAAGFEVADHTFTHPDLRFLSDSQVALELQRGTAALATLTSDAAPRRYMRPPHGRYTEATIRVAQRLGYTTVLWTDDPGDWRTVTPHVLSDHVAAHATAPEILLLHNGKLATIEMLENIVPRYRAAGYRFVTVGTLLSQATIEDINHPEQFSLPAER